MLNARSSSFRNKTEIDEEDNMANFCNMYCISDIPYLYQKQSKIFNAKEWEERIEWMNVYYLQFIAYSFPIDSIRREQIDFCRVEFSAMRKLSVLSMKSFLCFSDELGFASVLRINFA